MEQLTNRLWIRIVTILVLNDSFQLNAIHLNPYAFVSQRCSAAEVELSHLAQPRDTSMAEELQEKNAILFFMKDYHPPPHVQCLE